MSQTLPPQDTSSLRKRPNDLISEPNQDPSKVRVLVLEGPGQVEIDSVRILGIAYQFESFCDTLPGKISTQVIRG